MKENRGKEVKTIVIAVLLLFITFNAGAVVANGRSPLLIRKGEVLTLGRCIEIALANHPDISSSSNTVSVNESRAGQAKADYYPQIDWASGYSKVSPASDTDSSFSTSTANSHDQYSSSVNLRQNIYDFGKTSGQVQIQGLNLDASRSDLQSVTSQVVLNVRQAYYGLLKATRDRDVAEEAVRQFQQHLEQAKGFYEVGTKPKFDVTKAEVDLSNAKLELIRAENALRLAAATLNNSMGVPDAPEYLVEDSLFFLAYGITFEDAIDEAYKKRPDFASARIRTRAAGESIDLAETGHYPSLTGSAAYRRTGDDFPLNEGWEAGVTLSFPLFTGFLTTHQVAEARANMRVLEANEEVLRQNIFLEVRQAYLGLKEAEERIPAAELVVRQAEENLELAEGRYAAGIGNPIEVTDAQVGLSNAKKSYIQALYDHKIAQASLEKAMGVR